ncbi:hypothetical protein [uncultured Paraglaciecola sp.]|uniref:hypothetical protein n=1 Tax=uncultured Paraglaciecola sp. TaxID=1765024 RepID=UPI0026087AD0|nr:hypothetical protein [uncultured Paraglaciecola sp.]
MGQLSFPVATLLKSQQSSLDISDNATEVRVVINAQSTYDAADRLKNNPDVTLSIPDSYEKYAAGRERRDCIFRIDLIPIAATTEYVSSDDEDNVGRAVADGSDISEYWKSMITLKYSFVSNNRLAKVTVTA